LSSDRRVKANGGTRPDPELDAEPERVPELARRLLGTEIRSELMSREDALTIHKWAESLPGWEDERRLMLLRHPSQATVDWRDL
jgi:hypothetical protein